MIEAHEAEPEMLTVEELAAKLRVTRKTIYNRISLAALTREVGVVHLSARCVRIIWPVFRQAMLDGKIAFRGEG